MSDLVIPTIGGLKKAPARREKTIVVDELVDGPVYGSTQRADIRPSYTNRKRFDQIKLEKLAANIKEVGIIQPILIRPVTPTTEAPQLFEIVAGERRWRAAGIAALDVVPTITRSLTDSQAREIQILENLQREDPHPMEEAEGFQELMLQAGYTADQLVAKLEVSRSYIYGRLKLCALTKDVREKFLDLAIDASTALLLARIPVPDLQLKAFNEITGPYQGTGLPMSYRTALHHIQSNYTMDLTRAKFKLADAVLLPLAGACTKCLKKTGNQPEIFKDIKSADVCTDPACYAEKRLAHDALAIAAASKGGIPVYEGEEGQLRRRQNTNDRYSKFVPHPSALWIFDRNSPSTHNYGNTAEYLDGGLFPEPVFYVKDVGDDLIPFYHREPIQKLLEDAGACETVEVHAIRMADFKAATNRKVAAEATAASSPARLAKLAKQQEEEEAANERKEAAEELYRIELYKRLRARGANSLALASLRELAKLVLTYQELPDEALAGVYTFDTSSTESIHAYIDQASLPDVQLLMVDMLLGDCLITNGVQQHEDELATIHAMARHEGIEPDEVRLQLEMASIGFEDLQEHQLRDFMRILPDRFNDLFKFICAERPKLGIAAVNAAEKEGWFLLANNEWRHPTRLPSIVEGAASATDSQESSVPEYDEDAENLADQINLTPRKEVAKIEAPAVAAVDQPEPEIKTPAPRVRKPKTTAKPDPWPWPKSPAAGTTTPTPNTEAAPQ